VTADLTFAPTPELEWVACEICNQDGRSLVAWRTDLFLNGDAVYYMYACQSCGVVYQYPRPTLESIGSFYPSEYPQYTPGLQQESWRRKIDRRYGLRKRCRFIMRHVKRGRLLDVGCATGDFLSEMKRQPGWSVFGIEPNHEAARYARAQVGVEVIDGLLNDAPFADGSFDAITMWDVLEHVHAPRDVIAAAARLLRPGGVLVINHPNLASIDRRLFGRYWVGYELPRHLYLFPSPMLRGLMAEYGLEEVERRCFYGSHAATGTSLTFIMNARFRSRRVNQIVRRMFFNPITRILLIPYFKLIDAWLLGSNITAVFMRK
jgi:2-polyprenyl-3-methyl-5-hydroxy-6-metoxy-1,4-benzoquinol methylase